MSNEIPSNSKIYLLCAMHIARILSIVFIWISPLIFMPMAIIYAYNFEFSSAAKYSILSLVLHFSYPLVLDWFEDERVKFKQSVDAWSSYQDGLNN